MTRDELEAIRKRGLRKGSTSGERAISDRRALLAYVDQLLAAVAAADAWLAKDDEVEDDPLTVGAREAYRTARKTLK